MNPHSLYGYWILSPARLPFRHSGAHSTDVAVTSQLMIFLALAKKTFFLARAEELIFSHLSSPLATHPRPLKCQARTSESSTDRRENADGSPPGQRRPPWRRGDSSRRRDQRQRQFHACRPMTALDFAQAEFDRPVVFRRKAASCTAAGFTVTNPLVPGNSPAQAAPAGPATAGSSRRRPEGGRRW